MTRSELVNTVAFCLAATYALAAAAQQPVVVDTRAGLINYVEGTVTVDGQLVILPPPQQMFARKLGVREGKTLSTAGDGRAEVLLSAGVTLRLGPLSSFRMVRSEATDTRIELPQGSAVVEMIELIKSNRVTVTIAGAEVTFSKAGTYQFHAGEPERAPDLLVYLGEARVLAAAGEQPRAVKAGRAFSMGGKAGDNAIRAFDRHVFDDLLSWSILRSHSMARANISAATVAHQRRFGRLGGWMWSHYDSCYTYLPASHARRCGLRGACYYSAVALFPAGQQEVIVTRQPPQQQDPQPTYNPPVYSYDSNRGYIVAEGDRSQAGITSGSPVADSGGGRAGQDSGGRGGEGGGRAK